MDRFILKAVGLAVLATLVCSTGVGAPSCGAGCASSGDVAFAIRESLTAEPGTEQLAVESRRLYEAVSWQPLWIANSQLTRQARQVLDFLTDVRSRGLAPADYDVDRLRSLVSFLDTARARAGDLARIDLSISVAMLRCLSDLHQGRVDPATLGIDLSRKAEMDLQAVVVDVSRADEVAPVIESVEPAYPGYAALVGALARHRALAADTGLHAPPDPGQVVRPGDEYPGMGDLTRLLTAFGDLADTARVPSGQLDGGMVIALKTFQRRHGLEPDGVLGRATMAALRVPVSERVRQIELALERWRWLPHLPPDRYILVNVPEFRLRAYDREVDAQAPALTLNVVVGTARGRHQTPVFTATMREVVFHPFWDVPLAIARDELVPLIRRKPGYMVAGGFEVVRGPGENARVYPATDENLARVTAGSLRLRQRPGPLNALGTVKLVFPNRHGVFLHDTPERWLFTRVRRDFSHGCIRVERPATLAEFVLRGAPDGDKAARRAAIADQQTLHVNLARPVSVFVHYITATVDEAGVMHFHPDLYQRDAALAAALPPAQH